MSLDRAALLQELALWRNNVLDLDVVVADTHCIYIRRLEAALAGFAEADAAAIIEAETEWWSARADRDCAQRRLDDLMAAARRALVLTNIAAAETPRYTGRAVGRLQQFKADVEMP